MKNHELDTALLCLTSLRAAAIACFEAHCFLHSSLNRLHTPSQLEIAVGKEKAYLNLEAKIMDQAATFSLFFGFLEGGPAVGKPMLAIEAKMARSLKQS